MKILVLNCGSSSIKYQLLEMEPQPELLAKVVAFKEKFYRTPWSELPDAKPGTLKLSPQPERLAELEADYESMRPMIFGDVPAFEEIVAFMDLLENRINDL